LDGTASEFSFVTVVFWGIEGTGQEPYYWTLMAHMDDMGLGHLDIV
jgi:hypothetical protein